MPRPSDRPTGEVWRLLQRWADEHPLRPNQRQMARLFGVSDSLLSNWKFMDSVMQPEDVELVAQRTEIPVVEVRAAAAADLPIVLQQVQARRGSSHGRKRRDQQDADAQREG